jgi:choline-sulfatase
MTPGNVLVLMSDEHNPKFLGAAGHPFIATPHLDALAARGTRFTSAYTTCPICVPARAAFATGRYVHEIGYWDNADAYDGSIPSWHHALRESGHRVVSIGKLHFRGLPGDDHGFSEEIVPMHVVDGIGDVKGLVREDIPTRKGGDKMARRAGPGESSYTAYDRDIAARAQVWLHDEAPKWRDKPWVLFVSFRSPRRRTGSTATGDRTCRCRSTMRRTSVRVIRTFRCTSTRSTTMPTSRRRRTSSVRSPATPVSSP